MKKCLLLFIFTSSFLTYLSAQSWFWGVQGNSGHHSTEPIATAINKSDNVFLTGYYQDSLTFGSYKFTTSNFDAFLVKYDSSGNLLWAVQPTASTFAEGHSLSTDLMGNIYMAGYFQNSLTFGSYILNTTSTYVPFIVKYDANGNIVWAKQGTATGNSFCNSVVTDLAKNSYITGNFIGTLTLGTYNLTAHGSSGIFIAKYDSNGNVIWAKQPYVSYFGQGESVATDALGNVYLTGNFQDTLILGPYKLIASLELDIFLAKYDSSGNVIWAKQTTIPTSKSQGDVLALATDESGNAYLTGYFKDTVSFGSHLVKTTSPSTAIFLAKYDSSGNALWAESGSSIYGNGWEGYSLGTDNAKHVYIAGGGLYGLPSFSNYGIVFGTDTLKLNHVTDPAIVVKFDSNGNVLCGSMISSGGDDWNSISVDPTGKYIYLGGDLWDTAVIFGPDTIGPPTPVSMEYPFVARWHADCGNTEMAIDKIHPNQDYLILSPNPCTNTLNISFENPTNLSSIQIIDITGRVLLTTSLSLTPYPLSLAVSSLSSGMYFIRINTSSGTEMKKFIKE